MKRKLTVTITKIRRHTVTVPAQTLHAHCPTCGRKVETVTLAEAARILQVDNGSLAHLAATGQIHPISTVTGNQRICKDSLFRSVGNE